MLGFGELFQYTNSHFRNTHIFAGDILPWFGTPLLAESLGAPFDSLRQRYLQQTNENTDMKQVNSTRSFGCSWSFSLKVNLGPMLGYHVFRNKKPATSSATLFRYVLWVGIHPGSIPDSMVSIDKHRYSPISLILNTPFLWSQWNVEIPYIHHGF